MSREECEKTQTIIFDREKNTLKILTTNNFPEELQKITKSLEQKWFKIDIDYTSTEGFKQAMTRYDEYEEKLKNEEEKEREQKTASSRHEHQTYTFNPKNHESCADWGLMEYCKQS